MHFLIFGLPALMVKPKYLDHFWTDYVLKNETVMRKMNLFRCLEAKRWVTSE